VRRGGQVQKFNLRLPVPLYERLKREAEMGEMSLNKLIVAQLSGPAESEPWEPSCDHEPYKSQGNSWCYRCGKTL
jgi:HicB-like protein involved in pilus formation